MINIINTMLAKAFKSLTRRLIFILIAISLITDTTSSTTTCAKGCLKCNTDTKKCQICDFFSGFSLKSEACEQLDIKDCKVINPISEEKECLTCNDEMIFDASSKKCTRVLQTQIISNCKMYENNSSCLECKDQHFMSESECKVVDKKIDSCLKYKSATLCSVCSGNSKLSANEEACTSFDGKSNCQSHSTIKCDSCATNFVLDPNQHFTLNLLDANNLVNKSLITKLFVDFSHQGKYKEKRESPFDLCQPLNYKFCDEYTKINDIIQGCATCKSGYILNSSTNSCDAFPTDAPITNCEKYQDGNTCSKCENQFYLTDSGRACDKADTVDLCKTYLLANAGCEECEGDNYLSTPTSCLPRSNDYTCENFNPELDECKCETNEEFTTDKKKCLPKIDECTSYEASTKANSALTCAQCNTNFYPVDQSCQEQNEENCTAYTLGTNLCTACKNHTFYITIGSTPGKCEAKDVNKCEEYTDDYLNKCKKCENLYHLTSGTSCDPINKTNCAKNTSNSNDCIGCQTTHILTSGACDSLNTYVIDNECTTVEALGKCTACSEDKITFEISNMYEGQDNCAAFNGDVCSQCAENFDGNTQGGGCKANAEGTPIRDCKQLKTLGPFSTPGTCFACVNSSTHYNPSGNCTLRSTHTINNCKTFDLGSDTCSECNDTYLKTKIPITNICLSNHATGMTGTETDHCTVYDYFDKAKCLDCEPGFVLNSARCTTMGSYNNVLPTYYFDDSASYNLAIPPIGNVVLECKTYDVISLICIECNNGYILLQTDNNTSTKKRITSAFKDNIYNDDDLHAYTCEVKSAAVDNWARSVTGTIENELNCAVAIKKEATYFCLSCKKDFIGHAYNIIDSFLANGVAPNDDGGNWYNGVVFMHCTSPTEFTTTTNYKNPYYREIVTKSNHDKVFRQQIFDTCNNSDHSLVYFLNKDTLELKREGAITLLKPYAACMTLDNKYAHCQVHVIDADDNRIVSQHSSLNTTAKAALECLACKPGYRYDNSNAEKCIAIADCNTNSENTWLGSCQTCSDDHVWDYILLGSNEELIDIQSCVSSAVKDCLVGKEGSTSVCILCKDTHFLMNNICVTYPDTICEKGWMKNNFASTSEAKYKTLTKRFMSFNFKENILNGSHQCAECKIAGYELFRSEAAEKDNLVCEKNFFDNGNVIDDCLTSGSINKCSKCKPTHVLIGDNSCQKISALSMGNQAKVANCLEWDESICTRCFDTHLFDENDICVMMANNFCETIEDSNTCLNCVSGYKPHPTTKSLCVAVVTSDPCIQYGKNDECLLCKVSNHIPIYSLDKDEEKYKIVYCVPEPNNYNVNMQFTYKKIEGSTDYHKINYKESYTAGKQKISMPTLNGSAPPQVICVSDLKDVNCTSYDTVTKYECDSCADGFYLNDKKTCVLGTILGCLKYTNSTTCAKCNNEKEGNASYYLDRTTCTAHTCTNCDTFFDNKDVCETCPANFYFATPNCIGHDKRNVSSRCKDYDTGDKCTMCQNGYYLAGNYCEENNIGHCDDKSITDNECRTCEDGYYGLTTCIKHDDNKECEKFSTSTKTCSKCKNGYYASGDKCKINPNGIKDCVFYSDLDTCIQCASSKYLDENNECKDASNISNCKIYKSETLCKTCDEDKLKSDNEDQCTSPTEKSCHTWTNTDSCATCTGNKVLDTGANGNKTCVESGISLCSEATGTKDSPSCVVCTSTNILKDGRCSSPKKTISDCEIYTNDGEKCESCANEKVLSFEKDICQTDITNAGNNCLKAHIVSDTLPSCIMCEFGYRMNSDGVCETCGGEGCTLCNSLDNDKCELCSLGYFMDDNSACSLNDPQPPNSVRVITMAVMFALVSLFLKNE